MLNLTAASAVYASPTLPTGGSVVAGQANLAQSGSTLTVTQTSARSVIDWSSFSIGQAAKVQFNNGTGATLNRVLDGGPVSKIDGALSAIGSIYLINPDGVIVGKNGVISVGGAFVASTLDLSDSLFMAGGNPTFSGPSSASVVNYGKVGSLGGDVVLIALHVLNTGDLSAANGEVGLLAGSQVQVEDRAAFGGKFVIRVGDGGSVTNSGTIAAAAAELRTENGNIYALGGNTRGLIRATLITGEGGQIQLTAPGGSVYVSSDAVLDASATGSGTGGHVYVDSADTTFAGTALAKGGPAGGDGGLVETSGTILSIDGARVDTTAADGRTGSWLLDPYNVTISTSTSNGMLSSGTFTPTGNDSTLSAATLIEALATTSVSVTTGSSGAQAGTITVASPLAWTSANTLTLSAASDITLNAAISATNGYLHLDSAGTVTQTAPITAAGLLLTGAGPSVTLTNPANAFSTLAISTTAPIVPIGQVYGAIDVADGTVPLTIGTIGSVSGASAGGPLTIATGSSLTIAAGASVRAGLRCLCFPLGAAGAEVVLSAAGAFINDDGSLAINQSPWLIYSASPSADTFDGLNSFNTAVWNTPAGAAVSVSGNRYVFAYQPSLQVATINDAKTYGADATSQIQADYVVTGQPGVSGAYLGDTGGLYSGVPLIASAGAPTSAPLGAYPITAAQGSLTVTAPGYAAIPVFNNTGVLSVVDPSPAALAPANGISDAAADSNAIAFSPRDSRTEASVRRHGPGQSGSSSEGQASNAPYPDNRWVSEWVRFRSAESH